MPTSSRLPFNLLCRYGAGQIGGQMFRDAPAALLPLFMTTILGVPAWMGGVAILLPKIWVIVCDPLVGAWSDRLKARHGRAPFLLIGALATALGFIALFSFSGFASPIVAAATVGTLYLLGSTGFSIFSVPYLAIASELSDDTNERSRLMASRVIFATVGVLLAVGATQPLVQAFGGGAAGWRKMGTLLGLIAGVAMLTTAFGLRRVALISDGTPAGTGLFRAIGKAFAYRPFALLILTYMLQSVAQACGYAVLGFVFLYGVGSVGIILPFICVMTVGGLLGQPIWLACALRIGKPATLTLSILTDTIGLAREAHGSAEEGVFSGIFSATEKLSFAVGPLVAGVVMSAAGFKSSTTGAIAQGPGAVTGILLCYSLIPASIATLSLAAFWACRRAQVAAAVSRV